MDEKGVEEGEIKMFESYKLEECVTPQGCIKKLVAAATWGWWGDY